MGVRLVNPLTPLLDSAHLCVSGVGNPSSSLFLSPSFAYTGSRFLVMPLLKNLRGSMMLKYFPGFVVTDSFSSHDATLWSYAYRPDRVACQFGFDQPNCLMTLDTVPV
ncbi:hypothetical protein RJT34_05670 [Clitoria ternatea]|uniref:Uncharacterized protein n=1 Tax=Clitoria ternatea TaxID=43366 RepID=A0AAN9PSQ3_CLITE